MLTAAEIVEARDFLQKATSPLFLFDDDCDGLCAYLLLKKACGKKGQGIPLKAAPTVDPVVMGKIEEYRPDLVVVLDKPVLSQEFIASVHAPVVWFDHHPVVQRKGVYYYNPRVHDPKDNRPTTYLAYQVAQQALWIATVGCIADWYLPDFLPQFKKDYPGIITRGNDPGVIMFETPMGILIKTFYFLMKGKTSVVKKNLATLEKIEHPEEILRGTTEAGKFLTRQVQKSLKEYTELLERARQHVTDEKLFVFLYRATNNSYTSLLANELAHLYPEKLVIVGREKGEDVRMSLRNKDLNLPRLLERVLASVKGHGGGHEHACGSTVAMQDFERFILKMKEEVAA